VPPAPAEVLKHLDDLQAAGIKDGPEWFNAWADYWRYVIGVNAIPADPRWKGIDNSKIIGESWIAWQTEPITDEIHEKWKTDNIFYKKKGMAIVTGKVWHNKQAPSETVGAVDMDNLKAIQEFCTVSNELKPLSELAERSIVEQHLNNPKKGHFIAYFDRPLINKSSDNKGPFGVKVDANEIPAFEVMGSRKLIFVTPSIHKDGSHYQIIGIKTPNKVFTAEDFEQRIDNICRKYGIKYLEYADGNGRSQIPIEELFKEDFIILKRSQQT
jgi:hypothetical protein